MKRTVLLYSLIVLMMFSCKKETVNQGIIDPPEKELEDPKITSISPTEGGALSIVTITGENFSLKKEQNEVSINGTNARIISSNGTSIQAEIPIGAETGPITVKVRSKSVTGPVFKVIEIKIIVYMSETFAGTIKGYQEGDRAAAKFSVPEGVAFDSKGYLIIADRDNHVIRKISPSGDVFLVAGVPNVTGSDDGPAFTAKFKAPLKVAVDKQDNIYVADRDNNKIRKIDAITGVVSTVAGEGTREFADGAANIAKFHTPSDLVVANDGVIYVADAGNNRIRKIAVDGTVSTLAGEGSRAFADGTGIEAKLADPSGIDLDKDGNIIVADRRNNRIRKITPAGVTTTIAGKGSAGYVDGPALDGTLSGPFGISVASDGTMYVAELGNHAIRMITTDNMIKTIAGDANRETGLVNGNPSKYSSPADLIVGKDGNIYVADIGNNVIRRIVPTEK